MTTTPAPDAGRWARCHDVLTYETSAGAAVAPAGGGAAVALSGPEGVLWQATAEPVSLDTLASLVGADVAQAGLVALAELGVLREVP